MFTITDDFDKKGYIDSKIKVLKFVSDFNNKYFASRKMAVALDQIDKNGPDVLVSINNIPYKYLEIEHGIIYNDIWIYERRIKKTYDLPALFVRVDNNKCYSIDTIKMKDACATAEWFWQSRTTANVTFRKKVYRLPLDAFNKFTL